VDMVEASRGKKTAGLLFELEPPLSDSGSEPRGGGNTLIKNKNVPDKAL
jgi:hypothetical protein